jgi:hypothetical protein
MAYSVFEKEISDMNDILTQNKTSWDAMKAIDIGCGSGHSLKARKL